MIASPCINICRMNAASGLCEGCFRTLDEIAAWSKISDDARQQILGDVARRRRDHQAPGKPAPDSQKNG